jgi:hypothetical protein
VRHRSEHSETAETVSAHELLKFPLSPVFNWRWAIFRVIYMQGGNRSEQFAAGYTDAAEGRRGRGRTAGLFPGRSPSI